MKKETLAQVFACEFFKIFNNTFSTEHHRATASEEFLVLSWVRIIFVLRVGKGGIKLDLSKTFDKSGFIKRRVWPLLEAVEYC